MLFGSFFEFAACDMLVKLDIALRHLVAEFRGSFRHGLALFAHEAVVDEPLAHELLES